MTFERSTKTLTETDLRALRWAVREAKGWRGGLVGDPDPSNLKAFDAQIKRCKVALQAAKLTKQELEEVNS